MELSSDAASFEDDIVCDFNLLTKLDLIFAKASFPMSLKRTSLSSARTVWSA